jgi:o-succinylbenzoate synthase
MKINVIFQKYVLDFKFEAGTSRGILKSKDTYFIKVSGGSSIGYGECSLLKGLSFDDRPEYENYLEEICQNFDGREFTIQSENDIDQIISDNISSEYPSIVFGFETALRDLLFGGTKVIYKNGFVEGKRNIPINGLIWMGEKGFMLEQVNKKLEAGFKCLKMKIGAIKFEEEYEVLEIIRKNFNKDQILIRVDANGAFDEANVFDRLAALSKLDIHSIEQPVKPGQHRLMHELALHSPVPIALDEELIGITNRRQKEELLNTIRPPYIILKPSLLGGFKATQEWIEIAEGMGIGWWITSALEANIGLNAICQFTANFNPDTVHGLGTGQLYHNNIASPLFIKNGEIGYDKNVEWDIYF